MQGVDREDSAGGSGRGDGKVHPEDDGNGHANGKTPASIKSQTSGDRRASPPPLAPLVTFLRVLE